MRKHHILRQLGCTVLGFALSAATAWTSDLKDSSETTQWYLVPNGAHLVVATQTPPTIGREDADRAIELHSMLNQALSEYLRRNPGRAAAKFVKSEEARAIWRDLHAVLVEIYRKSGISPREYSLNLASRTFVRWASQAGP
jgi:hypothetical protein